MRRIFTVDGPLPPLFVPILGAVIALAAARSPAAAQDHQANPATKTYVIAASEGYGVSDCFKSGNACGEIVASSWCESRGHGKPAAWGSTDDVTATIRTSGRAPEKGSLIITCKE